MFGHTLATWRKIAGIASVLSLVMIGMAACGTSSAPANTTPIKIGISLSLTGDFSSDGISFKQGYELWAKDINAAGGLLHRKVQLDILDDTSSDTQTTANYQELIATHHDDLVFGPFSTLLTVPASVVTARYNYALVEGAGGAPKVFNRGLNDVFDVSLPVANNLLSFASLLKSLPSGTGPMTVGYATSDDPFTKPQVDIVKTQLDITRPNRSNTRNCLSRRNDRLHSDRPAADSSACRCGCAGNYHIRASNIDSASIQAAALYP